MTNHTATAAAAAATGARAATRPNSLTRFAYRLALVGMPCVTCLLPVAHDGAQGTARVAGSADLAHRVAVAVSGSWATEDVNVQCHTCNDDARRAGIVTLSGAAWTAQAYTLPSRPVARSARDSWVPQSADGLPDATARRAARAARGVDY